MDDIEQRISELEDAFAAHLMLSASVLNATPPSNDDLETVRKWCQAYADRRPFKRTAMPTQ